MAAGKNLDFNIRLFGENADAQKALDGTDKKVKSLGDSVEKAGFKVKTLVSALGFAGAAALGTSIIRDFANLDDVVRRAAATTGEFTRAFPLFLKAATFYGETTRFTAIEAAQALQKLAMAGLGVEKSIATLPEVLKLSSASGSDLAVSADILTNIMSQYGATVAELPEINDKLVKTFTSTNTSLEGLGYSFSYVGPVAKASNQTFSDLAATIGVLGNNGFQGERSGTALRSALIRLQRPPRMVREALQELGISITDSSGKMRPFLDIIDELGAKSAKNAQIFKIFGTEAAPAIVTLVSQGTAEIRKLSTELDNSAGTAEKLAKDMESGLGGSIRLLNSAIEGTSDAMGKVAESPIKEAIDIFTENVAESREQFVGLAKDAAETFNAFVRGIDYLKGFQVGAYALITILKVLAVVTGITLVKNLIAGAVATARATAATIADSKAKITALQAEIALTQAQIRATAAQITATQVTATKVKLAQQLALLNQKLALSNQELAATEAQLAAATGAATLSMKSLLSITTLVNVAFTAFLAYDFGSWARENFAWVEVTGTYIAQLVALMEAFFGEGTWAERMARVEEVNEAFAAQREEIGNTSKKERDAAAESAKTAQEKKDELIKIERERLEQEQKDREQALKDAEEVIDSNFDAQQAAQESLFKLREDNLKRELDQYQQAQKEKELLLKQQYKGDVLDKAILDSELELNRQVLAAKIAHNNQLRQESNALFNAEIKQRQQFGIDTGELDKARQQAERGILLESEKAYQESINALLGMEKGFRDKAIFYRKEIENQAKNQAQKLREIELIGLSDAEQIEKKKAFAAEDAARIRQLVNKGQLNDAIELSKEVQGTYLEIAKAEKQALADGKGSDSKVSLAIGQFNNSVKLTQELMKKYEQTLDANADKVSAKITKQKNEVHEIRAEIDKVNQAIIEVETLTINVDTSQVDAALKVIQGIPNQVNVGINASVNQTPAFANGGIMTADGPVPLKKYARGGVADNPQLALFGEGSMPEAYVPLPDGRRIPVSFGQDFLAGLNGLPKDSASLVQGSVETVNLNMDFGRGLRLQAQGQRSIIDEFIAEYERRARLEP